MLHLPATAGRTTHHLTRTAWATGIAAALLTITTAVAETVRHTTGDGPGAHKVLLLAVGVASLAAVSAGITAGIRHLITTATKAVLAEQAASAETLRQLVAEVGRLRALLRDRDDLVAALVADQIATGRTVTVLTEQMRKVAETLAAQRHPDYWRIYADVLADLGGVDGHTDSA